MKNVIIEPMACPQSAVLTVSREELGKVCDEAWAKHGLELVRKFNTKFQKDEGGNQPKAREYLEKSIGVGKLYSQEISDFAVSKILESTGKKVLFIHSIPRINDVPNSEDINLFFVFYFTPRVQYDGPTEWELAYTPEFTLEALIQNQTDVVMKHEFTGCLNSKCRFTLELTAGEKTDKSEYQSLKDIDYISLRDVLATHKTGDEFLYAFNDNGVDREFGVKVSEVFYRDGEELDDTIAKTYGFDSANAMLAKAEERYNGMQSNRKNNMAVDHVITEIITKGKVDPIPSEFVQFHVKRVKEEQYKANDKETAWKNFGVKSEHELEEKLDQLVVQDFLQTMAFKCYADLKGLESQDIQEIANDIAAKINWV